MSSFPFFGKRTSNEFENDEVNIFLSHNSKNKEYGDVLRELLIGVGLTNNKLIYTSNENNDVPFGKNIYDYLQEYLNGKTIVLFLLSSDYFSSVVCLNELGATWVKKHDYYNFYVPGFNLKDDKFSLNIEVENYLNFTLNILFYYIPLQSISAVLIVGVFRAGGDTKFALIADILPLWCGSVLISAFAAFYLNLPTKIIYLLIMSDEIIKQPLIIWRYRSKKWINNVTRELN